MLSPRRLALGAVLMLSGCGSTVDPVACPEGRAACNGQCVDLLMHSEHCGVCGHACGEGVGCFAGACSSPALMPRPRTWHTAALGSDGRIYVFGGRLVTDETDQRITFVPEVDALDTRKNSWTKLDTELPTARGLCEAVSVDGKVLVLGGLASSQFSGVAPVADVDAFDVEQGYWEVRPALPDPRSDHASAALGGKLYVFWGVGKQSVLRLDGTSWGNVEVPLSVRPRWGARAVEAEGKVYLLGGGGDYDQPGTDPSLPGWDADAQVAWIDAAENWGTAAPMQLPHNVGGAARGPDGRIYYFGGSNADGKAMADVEVYDPTTDEWAFAAPMPEPRFNTRAVTANDGRIYVLGGMTQYVPGFHPRDTVLVYDPERDRWYW